MGVSQRLRWCSWLCALLGACGDTRVDSWLDVVETDGGVVEAVDGHWEYTSGEVDVVIDLRTTPGDGCTTTARLIIDKALASRDVYRLPETPCETLELTSEGDFVLYESTTSHDWTDEDIGVNSDRELINLGPWRDDAKRVTYEFILRAPECPDDHDCDCPRLERQANGETLTLELGRRCD